MSIDDLDARLSILRGEESIDDYPLPPMVDRTAVEDDALLNESVSRFNLLNQQNNRNRDLDPPWMRVIYDIKDKRKTKKKKKKKTKKKRKKRRPIKLFKKTMRGGMEKSIVPVDEDVEYIRSLPPNQRRQFLMDKSRDDPESFGNIMRSMVHTDIGPGPGTRATLAPLDRSFDRPIDESMDTRFPIMDTFPEFDDQLERKYVWETDIFDEDFQPNNLNYDNCRRLQDYCELYPKRCYLNKEYLESIVRPCQGIKKLHVARNRSKRLIQKFINVFTPSSRLQDKERWWPDLKKRMHIMYNNKYIIKTEADYNLHTGTDIYLQQFDLPNDVYEILQGVVSSRRLNQDDLYGEQNTVVDFLIKLRGPGLLQGEHSRFGDIINSIRARLINNTDYSELQIENFIIIILENLTDIIP